MQILKAGLVGTALIAAPALAQGEGPVVVEGGVPIAIVSHADLNLGSSSGLATLNGRINRAASSLCFERGHKDIETRLSEMRCFGTAIAGTKPQVERAIADRDMRLASSRAIKVAAR